MAELVIRKIEEEEMVRLRDRALNNGCSMEEEALAILRTALGDQDTRTRLGTEIAALFRQSGLDADIPELRGCPATPRIIE